MKHGRVLITGAGSGIGYETLKLFHSRGWQVAATVRKEADEQRLAGQFRDIKIINVDFSDLEDTEEKIGRFLRLNGGIEVVVNNAGYAVIGMAEEISPADYEKQMRVNFHAPVLISRLAVPFMRKQKEGRIVQVSSAFGRTALPTFSAYAASKFALEGFSEALRYELIGMNIYVSLIEPGTVTTEFEKKRQRAVELPSGVYEKMHSRINRLTEQAMQMGSLPENVAKRIWQAATDSQPALRYTEGVDSWLAGLSAGVPDTITEFAVRQMLDI